MSLYGIGETYHYGFNIYDFSNALANADALPTGILVVNGADSGAAVTIANPATGDYTISAALAARAVGDDCYVRISAVIGGVSQKFRTPPFRVAFPAALTGGVLTAGTGAAQLSASAGLVGIDLTPVVPTSNAANTVGDCLNAARAQGFGKWVKSGTTLTLYAPDGVSVVRAFTLDAPSNTTTRT